MRITEVKPSNGYRESFQKPKIYAQPKKKKNQCDLNSGSCKLAQCEESNTSCLPTGN